MHFSLFLTFSYLLSLPFTVGAELDAVLPPLPPVGILQVKEHGDLITEMVARGQTESEEDLLQEHGTPLHAIFTGDKFFILVVWKLARHNITANFQPTSVILRIMPNDGAVKPGEVLALSNHR